jgi:hypothetical protein
MKKSCKCKNKNMHASELLTRMKSRKTKGRGDKTTLRAISYCYICLIVYCEG